MVILILSVHDRACLLKFFYKYRKKYFYFFLPKIERALSKAHKQLLRGLHDIPNKRGNKSKIGGLGAGALANHHYSDFYILWWCGKAGLYGPCGSSHRGGRNCCGVANF